jgi:cytochrome c oxidase assembly factor CtaG
MQADAHRLDSRSRGALAVAAALLLYARGFVELRSPARPARASWRTRCSSAAASRLGTLAVVSPRDAIAEDTLLSAHMAQHLALGDLAPLALARAPYPETLVSGTAALRVAVRPA